MWVVISVKDLGFAMMVNTLISPDNTSEDEAKEVAGRFVGNSDHIILMSKSDFDAAGGDINKIVNDHIDNCQTGTIEEFEISDIGIRLPMPGTDFSFN